MIDVQHLSNPWHSHILDWEFCLAGCNAARFVFFMVSFITLSAVVMAGVCINYFQSNHLCELESNTWSFPFWSVSTCQIWSASSMLAVRALYGHSVWYLWISSPVFWKSIYAWFVWAQLGLSEISCLDNIGECVESPCYFCLHDAVKHQHVISSGAYLFSLV